MAKTNKKIGGMLTGAGLLIGLGIGMYYDKTAVGAVIGLGIGLLAAFIYAIKKK